ncbi:MAG: hypothetical protein ACOC05_10500 [Oceanicaulis sp.]
MTAFDATAATLVSAALVGLGACDAGSAADRRQFNLLDANRDGRLVRAELEASEVSMRVDGKALNPREAADWMIGRCDGRGGGAEDEALTLDEYVACWS